jgi:hypothetical protein
MGRLQETDIAWLAGIMDGEGYIGRRETDGRVSWRITIGNSDKSLVKKSVDIISKIINKTLFVSHRPEEHKKDMYYINVSSRPDVLLVLLRLKEYLTSKRDTADKCIDYLLEFYQDKFRVLDNIMHNNLSIEELNILSEIIINKANLLSRRLKTKKKFRIVYGSLDIQDIEQLKKILFKLNIRDNTYGDYNRSVLEVANSIDIYVLCSIVIDYVNDTNNKLYSYIKEIVSEDIYTLIKCWRWTKSEDSEST